MSDPLVSQFFKYFPGIIFAQKDYLEAEIFTSILKIKFIEAIICLNHTFNRPNIFCITLIYRLMILVITFRETEYLFPF